MSTVAQSEATSRQNVHRPRHTDENASPHISLHPEHLTHNSTPQHWEGLRPPLLFTVSLPLCETAACLW